jgi:hypothetical protein
MLHGTARSTSTDLLRSCRQLNYYCTLRPELCLILRPNVYAGMVPELMVTLRYYAPPMISIRCMHTALHAELVQSKKKEEKVPEHCSRGVTI